MVLVVLVVVVVVYTGKYVRGVDVINHIINTRAWDQLFLAEPLFSSAYGPVVL